MRSMIALLVLIGAVFSQAALARPLVLTSIEPVALLVREICDQECEVRTILPKGVSEHSWQPGPKDMIAAKEAVAVIAVGLDFDNRWMRKLGVPTARVLWLGPELSPMGWWSDDLASGHAPARNAKEDHHGHKHEHHSHGQMDPHIWTDAARMSKAAGLIAAHLLKSRAVAGTHADSRAKAIHDRLVKLDVMVDDKRRSWQVRPIVVFHDMVGYFARRFNLPVLAVATGASGHDLSAKMIADVHRRFAGIKIAGIFVDHEDGASRNLARELKVPVRSFDFAAVKSYKNYDEWFTEFVASWEQLLGRPSP